MLGLSHRYVDRHVGYMAPVVDDVGRSSMPDVFVIGDGADLGGARVARARGMLAGHAAAAALDASVRPDDITQARRDLTRARAFQNALWQLYAAPRQDFATIDDRVIVCRCEELSAGQIRDAIRKLFGLKG